MPTNHPTQFINGQWLTGLGDSFISLNPSNNQQLWQGQSADDKQVHHAVSAARNAFETWTTSALEQRLTIIKNFAHLLEKQKEKLTAIIAKETGKPRWEASTEVAAMIAKVDISITAFQQRTGTTEKEIPQGKAFLRHKAHGVVAVFGPYNFPGHLPNGHIIPALIAGNTVIFKASELTPWVAEFMITLWQEAEIPSGVINLLQGDAKTGKQLANHSNIDGLFFTGSSATGKLLHQQFSTQPEKILALEMGGNNPLIVKEVADTDAAVHDIIHSAFITSGQRCTCARRLFIEDNAQGDAIINRLIAVTNAIKIGQWDDDEQPFMGSMISTQAAEKMLTTQQELLALGAKSLLPLKHLTKNTGLVSPGIIDVSNVSKVPDEEFFGPLLQVYRYRNFEHAIEEANNTRFGLSAGLLSDDESLYQLFYNKIRAGIVNWNKPITGAVSSLPFGGIGASGNHHPSAFHAADYCSYPVASIEATKVSLPASLSPGLSLP